MIKENSFNGLKKFRSIKLYKDLPEEAFDDILQLAEYISDTPAAGVSLMTENGISFKSLKKPGFPELQFEDPFFPYVVKHQHAIFQVEDLRRDGRFKNDPLVTHQPHLVYYAGVPLFLSDGSPLGCLCVMDFQKKAMNEGQINALQLLANQVVEKIESYIETVDLETTRKGLPELRLKNISDNIPGILFQYHLAPDGKDKMNYVSKAARKIWGFSPEDCMRDSEYVWRGVREAGDSDTLKNSISESAKHLSTWRAKWRYVMPGGNVRYHEGYGAPHRLADGTTVWDSIIMDITKTQELEELAERTASIARIGNWEFDFSIDNDPVYLSSMIGKILELDKGNYPARVVFNFFEEESKKELINALKSLVKKGESFDLELLAITAKGASRWTRCIGRCEMIRNKCIKIYGSLQDIHNQKSAELGLINILDERNDILESIGDAFFAINKNWVVTYWNKEAEELLGKKRGEVLGKNVRDSCSNAFDSKLFAEYQKVMDTGEIVHLEKYYPDFNKWVEINVYPANNGISVYFKDVSSRKVTEEEIRQSNDRFEKIAEATNDAIWDYNIPEDKLFWGKGFSTLFGHDFNKDTPSFRLLRNYIHEEDQKRVIKKWKDCFDDPQCKNWFHEYRFLKSDGSFALVMERGVFSRNNKGEAIRAVGAMTDISHREEYENSLKFLNRKLETRARELAISNSELEQFAYVASHDLQEPLRMVSSFLNRLEKKYSGSLDEKAHTYINFAVDGADRMRNIILDLLEFSRVGKHNDQLKEISLNKVVEEIKQLLKKKIENTGAHIYHGDLPVIKSYQTPLLQILQNLISNSLKYVDEETTPEIKIDAKKLKHEWQISLSDNGIGIDPEYFNKIFEIFQRLHAKHEFNGTGMGLAIVKKNIENLGGRIWVESQPGKGSTFYFTLLKN